MLGTRPVTGRTLGYPPVPNIALSDSPHHRFCFENRCDGSDRIDTFWLVSDTSHVETINASDFKARCLAILDHVQATGERLVILKRGRPVAELLPPSRTHAKYAQFELKGTVIVTGDIVGPAVPEDHWEVLGP